MNFIPKELKIFLEDFKKTNRKILNASYGICDLNFNGETTNVFKIDFSQININEDFFFLIVISDLYIDFQDVNGIFSISVLTKDKNNIISDHGNIYTGKFENNKFKSTNKITTSIKINKPVLIKLKINSLKPVTSIFNVGVTIN